MGSGKPEFTFTVCTSIERVALVIAGNRTGTFTARTGIWPSPSSPLAGNKCLSWLVTKRETRFVNKMLRNCRRTGGKQRRPTN